MTIKRFGHLTHLTVEGLQLGFCLAVSLNGLEQVWDELVKLSERVEVPLPPVQVSNAHDSYPIEALTLSELQRPQGPLGPLHHPTNPVLPAHSSCRTRKRDL